MLIAKLSTHKQLFTCEIPKRFKDINDISDEREIKKLIKNANKVDSLFVKFN
jgi:hypothetical protein